MADEIQRVLFIAPKVHVYAVPPLGSNAGYRASQWNVDSERARIFMARLRIIETATTDPATDQETVRNDVRLEDPRTGDLFANCPYEVCQEQEFQRPPSTRTFVLGRKQSNWCWRDRAHIVLNKSSIRPASLPCESSMGPEKQSSESALKTAVMRLILVSLCRRYGAKTIWTSHPPEQRRLRTEMAEGLPRPLERRRTIV